MKKIFTIICTLAYFFANGQDEAIFNNYQLNPILINPSYAGADKAHHLWAHARAQWTGFPDAPKTFGAVYHGPIAAKFALGLGIFSETAAQMKRMRAQLNYAFGFDLSQSIKLNAGFSTEFQQISVDNKVFDSPDYMLGDPLVEDAANGINVFDAAVGVYATFSENSYVGLTLANLVRARLDNIVTETSQASFFEYFTLNAGHKFQIDFGGKKGEQTLTLEPSVLIRQIRNAPYQMDFNLKAGFFDEKLITGLSYRSLGATGILLGTRLEAFHLYYLYDLSFQRFQKYNSGSHEVALAFTFKKKDKKTPPPQ